MNFNDEKYEYVYLIADIEAPNNTGDLDNEGNYILSSSVEGYTFIRILKELKFPFTYRDYLNNEDIMNTLKGYEIDIEKFWYAVLFIYHYTRKKCVNVMNIGDTPRTQFKKIKNAIQDVSEFDIKVKGKKTVKISSPYVTEYLCNFIDSLLSTSNADLEAIVFKLNLPDNYLFSSSEQICFAAKIYLNFFDNLELPLIRGSKKFGISYNKLLLISRLMYFTKMTTQKSYLVSDRSLKRTMEEYKDREIHSFQ